MEKLKVLTQKYGRIAVVTHVSLSLMFFGGFYFLISNKVIDPKKYLAKLGINDSNSKMINTTGDLALAYLMYKGTMLMRLPITVAIVPLVAKILKK